MLNPHDAQQAANAVIRGILLRKIQGVRAEAVQAKADIEYWNRVHPNEEPLDSAFADAVIACCDGCGAVPGKERL